MSILDEPTQQTEKKLTLVLDIFQSLVNFACIYLLWVYVSHVPAVIIGLFELIRLGTYFSLGQKAKGKVLEQYLKNL